VLIHENAGESFLPFAEACGRFTPTIALRPDEAIFLEIGGSARLYSESSLPARITALAQRFGVRCRVAVADNAPSALAMARYPMYQRTKNLRDLPLAALFDYAHPFADRTDDGDLRRRMNAKITAMIHVLELLGVRSLGEFATLPRETLASRFGKEAIQLSARIWGMEDPAWPVFRPVDPILEKEEVDDVVSQRGTEGLEALVFVLRGVVDRAMARLRGRGERASVIRLGIETEKWSVLKTRKREWRIELPLAHGSVAGLVPILQERLSFDLQREPLRAPIQRLELEIVESVPGVCAQRDLFSRKEEEAEEWRALVGRLTQKLGKNRAFVAQPVERYLPERAYARVLQDPVTQGAVALAAAEQLPERPARLLKNPEPLSRQGQVLQSTRGRRWRALDWLGPERLAGEWWKDPEFKGFKRDYYRVVTEGGELLWVYINRLVAQNQATLPQQGGLPVMQEELFLHGYFD
jgi:protein ImuB